MLAHRVLESLPPWFHLGRVGGVGRGKEEKKATERRRWNPMRFETRVEREPDVDWEEEKKNLIELTMIVLTEDGEKVVKDAWRVLEMMLDTLGEILIEFEHVEGRISKEDVAEVMNEVVETLFDRVSSEIPGFRLDALKDLFQFVTRHGRSKLFQFPEADRKRLADRWTGRPDWIYQLIQTIEERVTRRKLEMMAEELASRPIFKKEDPKIMRTLLHSLIELQTLERMSKWEFALHQLNWDRVQPHRRKRDPRLLEQILSQRNDSKEVLLFQKEEKSRSGFVEQLLRYYTRPDPKYPRVPKDILSIPAFSSIWVMGVRELYPPRSRVEHPFLEDVAVLATTLYVIHDYLFQLFTLGMLRYGTPDDEKSFQMGLASEYFDHSDRAREWKEIQQTQVQELQDRLGPVLFCTLKDVIPRIKANLPGNTLFSVPFSKEMVSRVLRPHLIQQEYSLILDAILAKTKECAE